MEGFGFRVWDLGACVGLSWLKNPWRPYTLNPWEPLTLGAQTTLIFPMSPRFVGGQRDGQKYLYEVRVLTDLAGSSGSNRV